MNEPPAPATISPASRLSELRPRTVWDVVDDAFDLYRENFALFAGVSALVLAPAQLMTIVGTTGWARGLVAAQTNPEQALGSLLGTFAVLGLSIPFDAFARVWQTGAIARAAEDRLGGEQNSVSVLQTWRRTLSGRRAGALFLAALAVALTMLGVGMLTCFVGVFVVQVVWAFVAQAVVLEGRPAGEALGRSRALVTGYGWRVFGLILLLGLMVVILSGGVAAIMRIVAAFVPYFNQGDQATQQLRRLLAEQVVQALSATLLAPITPIALTLQYYDLRVRREGLDVEVQAEQIGYPLAADPFGSATSAAVVALGRRVAGQRRTSVANAAATPPPPGAAAS